MGGDFGKGGFKGKGKGKKGKKGKDGKKGGDSEKWTPMTKLGRLVMDSKIQKIEDIYLHGLAIREYQIVDFFFPPGSLKDEVCKIHPVQKMTSAGQRNRFVAYALVGDTNGHIGLGNKVGKEVATAIRGAVIDAKLRLIPIRRGYWGNKIGSVHTVPSKVHGKAGSVRCKLVPAPRGTGIVGAPISKKLLQFAGIDDVYTTTTGHTRTPENFIKSVFDALRQTYRYLTPDLWPQIESVASPFATYAQDLETYAKKRPEKRGDGRRGDGRGRGGRGRGGRGGRGGRDRPPRD